MTVDFSGTNGSLCRTQWRWNTSD